MLNSYLRHIMLQLNLFMMITLRADFSKVLYCTTVYVIFMGHVQTIESFCFLGCLFKGQNVRSHNNFQPPTFDGGSRSGG